jgi:periplasmic protein TonB
MLNVLLESKARRTRRSGGTLASTLVHAALFAGAITVTTKAPPGPVAPPDVIDTLYLPPPAPPETPSSGRPRPPGAPSAPTPPRLPAPREVPTDIPPVDIDVKTSFATDDEIARGPLGPSGPAFGGPTIGAGGPGEGVLEERYVDRGPRILGDPVQPSYPAALRERGVAGRVLVQFVVDTLGRAEMSGLRIVESTDPAFASSVRAVLPRYRFSPGEVGGQRVRTLVQLPFDFTLLR